MYAHLSGAFIYVDLTVLIVGVNFNCFLKESSMIYILTLVGFDCGNKFLKVLT